MHARRPIRFLMQAGRQRGLTLIELMVAMVIGLFLIGGVIGVFVANQQTSNTKQQLDRAQENFRFGSHTLMRVMRQGTGIDPASTSTELIVDFAGGPGTHDCVGTTAGGPNRFRADEQGRLVCTDGGNVDHVLMGDVAALNVSFGIDADDNDLIGNAEYVAHTNVADWTQVGSVRAALTLTNGQRLPFTATMRPVIIAAFSATTVSVPPGDGEDAGQGKDGAGGEGTGEGSSGDDGSDTGGENPTPGDTGGSDGPHVCTTTVTGSRGNFPVKVVEPTVQDCTLSGSGNSRTYSCSVSAPRDAAITVHQQGGGANNKTSSTTANCGSRTVNF